MDWCCSCCQSDKDGKDGRTGTRVTFGEDGTSTLLGEDDRQQSLLDGNEEDIMLEAAVDEIVQNETAAGKSLKEESLLRGEGHEINFYTNKRGLKLFEQKFVPSDKHPVATLLFVHGVHEHSARYNHVLEHLSSKGVVAYTFDAQSHGRSEDVRGLRGACNSFEEFVDDAEEFVERIRTEHPELPLFVWGQSFGGLVACFLAMRDTKKIKGLILTSPAINIQWTLPLRVQAKVAKYASDLTPDIAMVPGVDPNHMSKDPEAVREYVEDPYNTIGNLRCRLASETLQAFKKLARNHDALHGVEHMLVLFGDSDQCCSLEQAREFVNSVPIENKELKVFENMHHTLFHEPEHQDVINYMDAWLTQFLQ